MRLPLAPLAILLLLARAQGGPVDDPKSTADIVEASEPSIALVKGKGSMGTGFLVKENILVTNAHVIDDEFLSSLEVAFPSAPAALKGPYAAELLYEDRKRDLAILSVKVELPPLEVAEEYTFRKGEDITIIGNPGIGEVVLENAVSRGVLSTRAEIDGQKYYQLGVSINPGNSGGPVFDSQGRVIGVATLKSTKEEALAFSIPVEELREAIEKAAGLPQVDVDRMRSKHRAIVAFQSLGSGGALYSFGIDLKRIGATPAGANSNDVRNVRQMVDTALNELDKDAFPALTPEANIARKDPLLNMLVKDKVGKLADNFARLRSTYRARPGDKEKEPLSQMKARHRQLINELAREFKVDVPAPMMALFDDRGMPPPNALAGVFPRNPTVARPGSSGSLRQKMEERKTPSGRPGSKSSTLRDRAKSGRNN